MAVTVRLALPVEFVPRVVEVLGLTVTGTATGLIAMLHVPRVAVLRGHSFPATGRSVRFAHGIYYAKAGHSLHVTNS